MKGHCPDCEELHDITPGPKQSETRGTSRWWRLVLHKKPKAEEICDGSGKLI